MQSKTENRKLEIKAIKTILNGSPDMSAFLLGELKELKQNKKFSKSEEGHFGTEEGNEIYTRLITLLSNGKELPSLSMMITDTALSKNAKNFLMNTKKIKVISQKRNAKKLIETLEKYRKIRVVNKGIRAALNELKGDSLDIDSALIQLEDMITEANNTRTMNVLRFGKNDNTKTLLDRILSPDNDGRILTYYSGIDAILGGLRRKNLVVVSGPTGDGKSVLALNLAVNMYQKGNYNVCYVSFEMDEEEMYMRILSNIAYVGYTPLDRHELKTKDRKKIEKANKEFVDIGVKNNCRLDIWCPEGEYTATDIVQKLKPYKYDAIVIDYISLVSNKRTYSSETEANNLSETAKKFKTAAAELDCVSIVLAQWDDEHDRVRYARAIEEHANVMIKWKRQAKDADESEPVPMDIGKARNAKKASFQLRKNFSYMRWEDVEIFEAVTNESPENSYHPTKSGDSINEELI